MNLTTKQREVLSYIKNFFQEKGVSPTYSEIQGHFAFKSKGSVHDYISYLKKSGYLEVETGKNRGLILKDRPGPCVKIPILGEVAAGRPLEVMSDLGAESITVPQSMVRRGNCFALRVRGSSMIDDGILEGDVIIVRSQEVAENGDTVVALLNGGATVKRYVKKCNIVELHPANENMKKMVVRDESFRVQGIVVGLLRSYP